MAITLLELMERVGSRDEKRILAYIREAFTEIEGLLPEKTTGEFYTVTADTRLYTLPSDMIQLLGVYRVYDSTASSGYKKYVLIPRVHNIDMLDVSTGASTS